MGANDSENIPHKFRSKTPKLLRILRNYFANNIHHHDRHHHMENSFLQKDEKVFEEPMSKQNQSIRNNKKPLSKSSYTFDQPKKKKNLQKWKVKLFSNDKKEQIILKRQTNFDETNHNNYVVGNAKNGFENIQTFRRKNQLDFHQNPKKPDRRKVGKRIEMKNNGHLAREKCETVLNNEIDLLLKRSNSLKSFYEPKSTNINRSQTLSVVSKELFKNSVDASYKNNSSNKEEAKLNDNANLTQMNEEKCLSEKEKNNIDKNITDVMLKRFNQSIRLKKPGNLALLPSTILPPSFSKTFLIPIGKYLNGEPMYEIVQMETVNNMEEPSDYQSTSSKAANNEQEYYGTKVESTEQEDREDERKPLKQNTFRSSLHLKSMLTCTGEKRFVPIDLSKESEVEDVHRIEINLDTSHTNDTLSTSCTNYQNTESDIDDSLIGDHQYQFQYHPNDKKIESKNNGTNFSSRKKDSIIVQSELSPIKEPFPLLTSTIDKNNNNNSNIINHIDIIKAKVFDYYKKNPQFPSASNSSTSSSTKYRKNSLEHKLSIDSDNSSYHLKTSQKNLSIFEDINQLNEICGLASSTNAKGPINRTSIADSQDVNDEITEFKQLTRHPPLSHELFPPTYGEALRHLAQVENTSEESVDIKGNDNRTIEPLPTYRQHVQEYVGKTSTEELSRFEKESLEELSLIRRSPSHSNEHEILSSSLSSPPPPLPPPISYYQTTTTQIAQSSFTDDTSRPSVKPKMKRETRSYTYLPNIIGEKIPLAVSRHLPEDLLSVSKVNENDTCDHWTTDVAFNVQNGSSSSNNSISSDSRFSQSNSSSLLS